MPTTNTTKRKKEPQELCNQGPLPQTFAGMKARYERDMAIRDRKEMCYEACAGIDDPATFMDQMDAALRAVWKANLSKEARDKVAAAMVAIARHALGG